jgi:signal transduction histidine kinase
MLCNIFIIHILLAVFIVVVLIRVISRRSPFWVKSYIKQMTRVKVAEFINTAIG